MNSSILIFDTTLRDGEQAPGCSMTLSEKIAIAKQFVSLNVDIIEAGFPAASEGEVKAVTAISELMYSDSHPIICGLARASIADINTCAKAIASSRRHRIHTFIATSDIHIEYKLKSNKADVLKRAVDAVSYAKTFTDDIEFSPEDATRSDIGFLTDVLIAAMEAGAGTLNIPDTVGYTTPHEYSKLISHVCKLTQNFPHVIVSTHCHNDLGLAVANSLAGVLSGAGQVECTINGIGERAGNAAIEEIVMALNTRQDTFQRTSKVHTKLLTESSELVSKITGIPIPSYKAIVGCNAFAHEAGIHQDGMLKNRSTYEIMTPESVGARETLYVLGKHSGRNAVKHRIESLGHTVTKQQLERISEMIKNAGDNSTGIDDQFVHRAVEITKPKTLFDKVWDAHAIAQETGDTPAKFM